MRPYGLPADLAKAQLDLAHTKVYAPAAGVLGEINIRPGSMAGPDNATFPLVEDGSFWIDANYKEPDLDRIVPRQPATIAIDSYPDRTFHGRVESLSPASGTAFSLLPPENATGNWVKVTQRFTVRLAIGAFLMQFAVQGGMGDHSGPPQRAVT